MSKSLLIVESPTKAKTLERYLGKDFIVKASVGHVKDLPGNRLGINIEERIQAGIPGYAWEEKNNGRTQKSRIQG